MTVTIRRKRGDTFRLRFLKEGGVVDATITATLKFSALEVPLQAAVHDAEAGIFELSFEGDTAAWPTGRAACDIKYARAGQTARTETFFVQMLEAMTP
jgi:hypothetical protein